jgi:hypothetical protein
VIVTNNPFHHDLDAEGVGITVFAEGFKLQDFGGAIPFNSLAEAFKAKQRHTEIYGLVKAIGAYSIPMTFDGELPEFVFGGAERRWKIGERYELPDVEGGAVGVLESGVVMDTAKTAALVMRLEGGRRIIIQDALSDAEVAAYRAHPQTFFGAYQDVGGKVSDRLGMFEWLHETYNKASREKLLEFMVAAPDIEVLKALPTEDLLLVYCERMAGGFPLLTGTAGSHE